MKKVFLILLFAIVIKAQDYIAGYGFSMINYDYIIHSKAYDKNTYPALSFDISTPVKSVSPDLQFFLKSGMEMKNFDANSYNLFYIDFLHFEYAISQNYHFNFGFGHASIMTNTNAIAWQKSLALSYKNRWEFIFRDGRFEVDNDKSFQKFHYRSLSLHYRYYFE